MTFAPGLTPFSGMVDLKVMGGSAFGSTMSQGACDIVGDLVDFGLSLLCLIHGIL